MIKEKISFFWINYTILHISTFQFESQIPLNFNFFLAPCQNSCINKHTVYHPFHLKFDSNVPCKSVKLPVILSHEQFLALRVCVCVRPGGSGKAMKLGSKTKDVDSFVNQLRSEGTGEKACHEHFRVQKLF